MKRYISYFTMVAVFLVAFPVFSQDVEQRIEILADLIQEAIENNPGLEAAVLRTHSAEKIISQAGALPDPQLNLGLLNLPVNSFTFDQEPMTGKLIGLMQMFPFPGKQGLAEEMAEFEATAVKYQQEEVRNQIVQMVKSAYYNLYAIDRAKETVQKNQALMEQFIRIVETKYATGTGLQQDVLRAQVEFSKLEDDLIMWQQKRRAAIARLNAILNRPVDSYFSITARELDLSESHAFGSPVETIEQQRPLLLAWKKRIQKAESSVKLARRDYWPNFAVGASYRQRDNLSNGAVMHDFFSATFSINIPLFFKRKQGAKVAEKELALSALHAQYRNVYISVLSDLESADAEMERNRKRVELYEGGILVQAQQSLESAQAGYQVGKVDFLTLISNWMMLQNYEMQYFFAMADFHKALANYELTLGGRLTNDSR
ncbi:MAG TPA: TolC family protein [Candidatus Heimdallarchaeota archaeon]|nr:TolC family protein [Candidatus Heimdallarchaeota archaeon]